MGEEKRGRHEEMRREGEEVERGERNGAGGGGGKGKAMKRESGNKVGLIKRRRKIERNL